MVETWVQWWKWWMGALKTKIEIEVTTKDTTTIEEEDQTTTKIEIIISIKEEISLKWINNLWWHQVKWCNLRWINHLIKWCNRCNLLRTKSLLFNNFWLNGIYSWTWKEINKETLWEKLFIHLLWKLTSNMLQK